MTDYLNEFKIAVIPQKELDAIRSDLKELKGMLQEKSEDEKNSDWIESVKIPKLLGISRKTWQTYRDKRLIPFSQIGNKIYVKRSDLEAFMKAHYIEAKN